MKIITYNEYQTTGRVVHITRVYTYMYTITGIKKLHVKYVTAPCVQENNTEVADILYAGRKMYYIRGTGKSLHPPGR
jgi:hypothetical protein